MKNKLFFLILLFLAPLCFAKNVTNGIVNYGMISGGHGLIRLNGDWEFYPNQTFTSLSGTQLRIDFINVPGSWSAPGFEKNSRRPSFGCNTYRILINGLRANYEYAVFSRHTPRNSLRIYANGMPVAEYGVFSRHKENFKAAHEVLKCSLKSDSQGTIELIIQVSNFLGGKAGIVYPIIFGEKSKVEQLYRDAVNIAASLSGALLFLILVFLMLWIFNRSETSYLSFLLLIVSLLARMALYDFNYVSLSGIPIPFGVQYKISNLFLFDAGIFCLQFLKLDVRLSRFALFEKGMAFITLMLFTVFVCVPVRICFPIESAAFAWAVFFAVYCLVRMFDAFRHGDVTIAVYCILYEIISVLSLADKLIYSPGEDTLWTLYELAVFIIVIFDIIYIGFMFELMLRKSTRQKNMLSEFYIAYRKFIPRNVFSIFKETSFRNISSGINTEQTVTIAIFSLKVVSPDNTYINLREQFETLSFYSSKVIEEVQKYGGTVISISNSGVAAIFTGSPDDAVNASETVRTVMGEVNGRRAEDYYPCILFNIAIHYGPVTIGIVGDRNRNDFVLISPTVLVAEKMSNIARAMNIPILISEKAESLLDEKIRARLALLGKIKFSDFSTPISLFGFIADSEKESGLEPINEQPVITQREADKYINL